MHADLIYDVGMHNGNDTAYYLWKGCRVVGVEANPVLAEHCRKRFAKEIAREQLTILPVAIGPSSGSIPFWINDTNDEFSSFEESIGCRPGTTCHPTEVEAVRFRDILAEYGVPYYLKLDIEGAEGMCLEDIDPGDKPAYISTEAQSLEYLFHLYRLGYRQFKVVDQRAHNYPEGHFTNENPLGRLRYRVAYRWRGLRRRAGRQPLSPAGYQFPTPSSGPFGDDVIGEWGCLEDIAYNWLHFKRGHRNRGTLNMDSWYDFHARADGA